MGPGAALAVVGAGCLAGVLNTVVGSGTLITFPTLLALGHPPIVANVSSSIGLAPGSFAGAVGLRAELCGQEVPARVLGLVGGAGALLGATLLMHTSNRVFGTVVPLLILAACVLMILQQPLARIASSRAKRRTGVSGSSVGAVFCTGIYGGISGLLRASSCSASSVSSDRISSYGRMRSRMRSLPA